MLPATAWQQHDVQELCRVMFDALEKRFMKDKDRQPDAQVRLLSLRVVLDQKVASCVVGFIAFFLSRLGTSYFSTRWT